jgi:transcription elongation factor GreA
MTPEGHAKLTAFLKDLKSVQRPANVRAIEEARAHGDLSENAEYHAAKDEQGMIVAQIAMAEDRLSRAQVIDPKTITMERIAFGATVTLLNMNNDEEQVYKIVGSEEVDVSLGFISYEAPVARALMGKEEGDEVVVRTPKGECCYEVEEVKYI